MFRCLLLIIIFPTICLADGRKYNNDDISAAEAAATAATKAANEAAEAARIENVGMYNDPRTDLYLQYHDNVYTDLWTGVKVKAGEGTDIIEVYVTSEGKVEGFNGVLQISCQSRQPTGWKFAVTWEGDISENRSKINDAVPRQVILNAVEFFCK